MCVLWNDFGDLSGNSAPKPRKMLHVVVFEAESGLILVQFHAKTGTTITLHNSRLIKQRMSLHSRPKNYQAHSYKMDCENDNVPQFALSLAEIAKKRQWYLH